MTVNKLNKLLTELIANGFGRREVLVAKESFSHPLEGDGVTNLPVQGAKPKVIYIADDDGGTFINKDGSERTKSSVVIFGFDYLADGDPPPPLPYQPPVIPSPTQEKISEASEDGKGESV